MYARALEEAQAQLVELHNDELQLVAVSAVALGASLGASAVYAPLAMPLFVGGLTIGMLGLRSIWRHWDLLDRLADDRDAYAIPAVRAYAARDARMDRRVHHAALIRSWTRPPADPRITAVAQDLEGLARELEDVDLELDPALALACRRLLTDPTVSPLIDETRPAEELQSVVAQIRAGFRSGGR